LAAGGCTLSLDTTKEIEMNLWTSRPAMSRADLADFMLKTSSDGAFIRMKPLVSA
jgi:hypothetical protein